MATLADIRAKLKEQETRASGNFSGGDRTSYPFWNLASGKSSVIRFLPDGNPNNTFFWVEVQQINLTFAGIKGEDETKPVTVKVPCVEMYNDGSTCPILAEVRPWWNDKSLEDMARKYWKKRSYVFQGLVVEDGLGEEETPDNPIRKFQVSSQIFPLIRAILVDPEINELPTDLINGIDFRINKEKGKGGWADYSTSKWARNTRPLSEAELSAIDQHGLFDLTESFPKKPSAEDLVVMKEMFEASVNGELYDPVRWSQFRPLRSRADADDTSVAAAKPVATPVPVQAPVSAPIATPAEDSTDWDDDSDAAVTTPSASTNRAKDILAQIRSRSTT